MVFCRLVAIKKIKSVIYFVLFTILIAPANCVEVSIAKSKIRQYPPQQEEEPEEEEEPEQYTSFKQRFDPQKIYRLPYTESLASIADTFQIGDNLGQDDKKLLLFLKEKNSPLKDEFKTLFNVSRKQGFANFDNFLDEQKGDFSIKRIRKRANELSNRGFFSWLASPFKRLFSPTYSADPIQQAYLEEASRNASGLRKAGAFFANLGLGLAGFFLPLKFGLGKIAANTLAKVVGSVGGTTLFASLFKTVEKYTYGAVHWLLTAKNPFSVFGDKLKQSAVKASMIGTVAAGFTVIAEGLLVGGISGGLLAVLGATFGGAAGIASYLFFNRFLEWSPFSSAISGCVVSLLVIYAVHKFIKKRYKKNEESKEKTKENPKKEPLAYYKDGLGVFYFDDKKKKNYIKTFKT